MSTFFNRRWHISTTPSTTKFFCTLFKLFGLEIQFWRASEFNFLEQKNVDFGSKIQISHKNWLIFRIGFSFWKSRIFFAKKGQNLGLLTFKYALKNIYLACFEVKSVLYLKYVDPIHQSKEPFNHVLRNDNISKTIWKLHKKSCVTHVTR